MPRAAREKSTSGYYHILLRGISRQNIFEDDEDNLRFIETVFRYKQELGFELHAYCLMGNHVHMLIKDVNNQLNLIMKKIAGSYAYYFNRKYDRVGHLFQDRFKSEAVEDDTYYLTVLRYIYQNPEKAGIASTDEYEWSSYREYTNKMTKLDTSFALELLDGQENFEEYINCINDDCCLEVKESNNMTDKQAKKILEQEFGLTSFLQITNMPVPKRNKLLHELKSKGLSVRQLARMTGLNRGVVQKA